jgi:hypothetical protein
MVVERNENEWIGEPPRPERAQVMKIAGAVKDERRDPRFVFAIELFDQTRRRGETEARPRFARIEDGNIARQVVPGIIQIEVQSSKSLCAQFTGRKRS